ncbi:MAG: signal peptidase I [Clostridia bacterium]|nr:signal peptidase I [Clostridia bacterium]
MKKKINLKPLETIFTIIKVICLIFLILLIAVLALQRFSNNEKAIGGFRVFNVATGSMIPKYQVGDVLIVKEQDPNTLEVGDDVTYLGEHGTFAGRVVTHQIIEIEETVGGRVFHTKGIANEAEDPTITGDQIYGKVIYKCLVISLLTKLMNNMTAFYIVFVVPFAILIFLQIKESRDDREESEEELDEDDEDEDSEDDDEYEDDDDEDSEDDEEDDEEEE